MSRVPQKACSRGPKCKSATGMRGRRVCALLARGAHALSATRPHCPQEPSVMLDKVLATIDADLPASLDRLFALLRIESISTDPAYREKCRVAADWLVRRPAAIGFAAEAHPTAGHPIVVAHHDGPGTARPVLRPLRRPAGRSARPVGEAAVRAAAGGGAGRTQVDRRARRRRRQGPGDDLRRGAPRVEGGHGGRFRAASPCSSKARRNRAAPT